MGLELAPPPGAEGEPAGVTGPETGAEGLGLPGDLGPGLAGAGAAGLSPGPGLLGPGEVGVAPTGVKVGAGANVGGGGGGWEFHCHDAGVAATGIVREPAKTAAAKVVAAW